MNDPRLGPEEGNPDLEPVAQADGDDGNGFQAGEDTTPSGHVGPPTRIPRTTAEAAALSSRTGIKEGSDPRPLALLERIESDFRYHTPKAGQPEVYETIRTAARTMARTIVELVPPGREQSSALTRLEEAVMHANAGVARKG